MNLPQEIYFEIFHLLTITDLISTAQVCTKFHDMIHSSVFKLSQTNCSDHHCLFLGVVQSKIWLKKICIPSAWFNYTREACDSDFVEFAQAVEQQDLSRIEFYFKFINGLRFLKYSVVVSKDFQFKIKSHEKIRVFALHFMETTDQTINNCNIGIYNKLLIDWILIVDLISCDQFRDEYKKLVSSDRVLEYHRICELV